MATSPAAAATMEIDLQPASTTATPVYTAPSPALMRQPPASTRQPPAPTTMRRGATTVLLGGASRTSTPALSGHEREDSSPEPVKEHPVRQRRIGSQIIRPDSHQENATMSEETESWILYFQLVGAAPEHEFAEVEIDRKDLTFGNLLTMKSRFGYSVRDFLYYKERCGNGVAKMIEIDDELDSDGMITMNGEEREVRLVLSRDKITEQNVTITPIKLPPGTAFYEDFTNEPIDEYKDWLAKLHAEGVGREYKDMFREDTVKTYSEWLRVEGKFDDIEAYAENPSTQSSEASNPTPSTHWPAHARRIKKHVNPGQVSNEKRKFKGRGPLKGLAVSNKRFKHGTTKLNIEFSSRLEGPVGGDQRYFVDEVVVYTRKHAPLIGVRKWKDIEDEVKEQIASEIMERWDLEDTEDKKKIIWSIANESYNGWRSAFSATYRAYDSFDERMRHKPEDLHIVEWHYLVLYFGTEQFQRDPQTSEELNDLALWAKTHSKGGRWTNDASKAVYEIASSKIKEKETESPGNFIPSIERNLIFQTAYKQTTRCKSSKVHGNGYLARYPSRKQLMTEHFKDLARSETESHIENEELKATLEKVQEQLQSQVAEREAEKEEHRRQMEELQKAREADKEELRKEFMSMLTAQMQGASPQVNQGAIETTADETTANATSSIAQEPVLSQREETTLEDEATLDQVNQKVQLIASTGVGSTVRTTRASLNRNQSQNKEGNGTPNFISRAQLTDAVSKRRFKKN